MQNFASTKRNRHIYASQLYWVCQQPKLQRNQITCTTDQRRCNRILQEKWILWGLHRAKVLQETWKTGRCSHVQRALGVLLPCLSGNSKQRKHWYEQCSVYVVIVQQSRYVPSKSFLTLTINVIAHNWWYSHIFINDARLHFASNGC